jgi:uncharacterized protein (TIGR04551 family)
MRILSRSSPWLPRLSRLTRSTLAGSSAALSLVLAAASAVAQPPPAPPPPPAPAPAPAPPPPAAPAAKAPAEPLMPPAPPPGAAPAPAAAPPPAPPDPALDAKALAKQGTERPEEAPSKPGTPNGDIGIRPSDVYAEDWWSGARPVVEFHGYFRVRAELFQNFALGRQDGLPGYWPQPVDNQYIPINGAGQPQATRFVTLCGNPSSPTPCSNNTNAGANMRFRINPEIHISDNLRIMAQIDMLDNLVLGSTPQGYYNLPSANGYAAQAPGGYTPLGVFSTTQWAPVAGVNSTQNSITVKRAWGEFMTPVGMLRFGRMPSQWGLGIVQNSGDGYDSDWQTTADRIMFITGIKKYDLYFSGMWDFANSGITSATFSEQQGQPYDLGQLDNVSQFGLVAARRRDPELQRLDLAKGDPVFNGGVFFIYRDQVLANDQGPTSSTTSPSLGQSSANYTTGLSRRGAWAVIPDIWFQFLWKKFRFEAEGVMVYGYLDTIESVPTSNGAPVPGYLNPNGGPNGYYVRQFGFATESEFRAIEDRLRIRFGMGWASGDPGLSSLVPPSEGLQTKTVPGDRTYSEFAFHPDYRVDLILFRNILSRVEGAYYFKPSVEYDFTRDKNGQKLGGGASVIWSRASEFIQTPGHARDLGIELDGKVYFQSKDGTLNDDHDKMGGFFTQLEYGVLFPLAGLGYLPQQQANYASAIPGGKLDTSVAQILRWYIGILY